MIRRQHAPICLCLLSLLPPHERQLRFDFTYPGPRPRTAHPIASSRQAWICRLTCDSARRREGTDPETRGQSAGWSGVAQDGHSYGVRVCNG